MPRLKPKYRFDLIPEQVRELSKTTQNYTSVSQRGASRNYLWQYHSWENSPNPDFFIEAAPVFDQRAMVLRDFEHGELMIRADEKSTNQSKNQSIKSSLSSVDIL